MSGTSIGAIDNIDDIDAGARRAIRDDLDDTLVVEAAAGTGKTTELVNRILRVLATGRARMIEIAAVTFTEKAAGELKLRLREALERERASAADVAGDDVRERLEEALKTLEEAHVNTIHGFCAELLRERPVEARVDPLFAVLTQPQSDRLYDRAFGAWLQEELRDPPEGLRRALRRTNAPVFLESPGGAVDRLRRAGRLLAAWRDFDAPWQRPSFDRPGAIASAVSSLHRLADLTAAPASARDNLFLDTDAVRRLSRQIRLETSFEAPSRPGRRDLDGWEGRLVDLVRERGLSRTRKGSGSKFGPTVTRTEVLAARDALFAELQQFKRDADADLAAALQQELKGATARYQELKTAQGALDYADLLARARDLIKTNAEVRSDLQQKFRRIFVDEFQDTDPIQAEILMLLSAADPTGSDWETITPHPGKLFIVGDPKQAIYRFRGADIGTYWRVSKQIENRGGRLLQLTTSYRSVPEIQRFINRAFREEMKSHPVTLQAGYVALSPVRTAANAQPAIVALPVPKPYSSRGFGTLKASARQIDESLPDAVGAFIAWLVDVGNGWTVAERGEDGTERPVPLQPRHVAVLFRNFVSFGDDVTRAYTDAIEARGLPHLLVGGKAFHGREEVETMRAALAAIEWPDDELSVFATLKGSLFAIDDEHLLEFRDRFGVFHPFRIPRELGGNSGAELALASDPTSHLTPIAGALRLLQHLHRARNHRPVADTIGRLLAETRAHVGFILRPAGEQALANVLHVAELARQYEASGGISFRGFIDELRRAAESESAEAPILEESSDGVRLMTVHKAKGLEFPVVILADLTCRISRNDASRYLDAGRNLCAMRLGGWAPHELHEHEAEEVAREEAEGVRLAYVAATRARDLLVVPALGDEPWEGGWFGPLNRALYPPMERRRDAAPAPMCPVFRSKDSVLERPNEGTAGPGTVCPGLHTFAADEQPSGVNAPEAYSPETYSVVWWDPHDGGGLVLGEKAPFGVRGSDLIVKDVPRQTVADGRSAYDRWRLARADALARGSVPSIVLETARAWTADEQRSQGGQGSHALAADARRVRVVDLSTRETRADRPGGAAFGALVHAVLAQVDLIAADPDPAVSAISAIEARVLGLSDEDAAAAVETVARVLQHELFARARDAARRGACRRETPITLTLADGTLVEGVADLAFEDGGAWTVVDYKTDREIAASGEDRYRRQIALYASAIAQATGARASGVLVRV
jgi:ATP-dependent helicase/nuclease subunit A